MLDWALKKYDKGDIQALNERLAVNILYQLVDRSSEIEKNTKRYNRLIGLKDNIDFYLNSKDDFAEFIPQINKIQDEINEHEAQKSRLKGECNEIEYKRGDLLTEYRKLEDDEAKLKNRIADLKNQETEYNQKLEDQYKNEEKELIDKIASLKKKLHKIQEKHDITENVAKLQEDKAYLTRYKSDLESETKKLKDEFKDLQERCKEQFKSEQNNAAKILSELVKSKTHLDFIRGKKFSSEDEETVYRYNYEPKKQYDFESYDQLRAKFIEILKSQNRKCEAHFVDNLLISTSQNLFTLFVGLPGTGKTSMARMMGACISGSNRIAEVSVGRGWTSHKELLGFYNPLSGNFVESHKGLHNKLRDLDYECNNDLYDRSPILYIILDEANLSPIEHYWSMFINDTDRDTNSLFEIDLGNGGLINHRNAIIFIGTINNDHTTEKISPRILDRVNLIYFRPEDIDQFNASSVLEELYVPKQMLEHFCVVCNSSDSDYVGETKLSNQKEKYKRVKIHMRDKMHIFLSPRIDNAMEQYCRVANKYMNEEDRPLDYFIAQRVLPLICRGNKETLEGLKSIISEFKLNKSVSVNILEQIIKRGEDQYDQYDYFSIVGY